MQSEQYRGYQIAETVKYNWVKSGGCKLSYKMWGPYKKL